MRIQVRLLRKMREIPDHYLRSLFRVGGEIVRSEVIHHIGTRGAPGWDRTLCACLEERSPAIRRVAAFALGLGGSSGHKKLLLGHAEMERCDTVRFHMLLSARRCGASHNEAWDVFGRYLERSVHGAYGVRPTGGLAGWTAEETAELWRLAGGGQVSEPPADPTTVRGRARTSLAVNADDRAAVVALGLMGHPDDVELLESLWGTAGRRMRLTLCKAMGLHGSAIFLGRLRTCLTVMDVDPGHGFALRVASSMALGRLGYTVSTRLLIGALTTEALEYEGSPGAGLGVQHSVRAHILAALGEIQSAPEVVETYLGNLHGNAQGGFYLTAMDALWKHGNEQPMYSLMAQSEVVAANALGVIRALSGPEAVSGWLDDERPMVARVAKGQSV